MDFDKSIVKFSWQDIRDKLYQIEPRFTEIVDGLQPLAPLYMLSFPYGEMIGDDLSQFIPHDDGKGFYRLTDENAPSDIVKHLGYGKNSAPLGMVLNKSIEFFVDLPQKALTIPIRIATAGEFYNFSRILSIPSNRKPFAPNGLLKATAGARTVFSLPYLTCQTSFNRLESNIGMLSKYPVSQYEHFQLFKEITNRSQNKDQWRMQLLYFSEEWVENILNNKKWFKLSSYLYQLAWKASDYKRNQYYYDISYSIIQEMHNCRTNPYLNDTARHILDVAIGAFPGLSPLVNDELLPLDTIQYALSYLYGLKKHMPSIIGPEYFDYLGNKPTYYPLQYPITRSFSPKNKNSISMLNHLGELKTILQRFLLEIKREDGIWYDTILQDAVQSIRIDYIHNNYNHKIDPISPEKIIERDPRFLYVNKKCLRNNDQPATEANFFRGCIGLTKNI